MERKMLDGLVFMVSGIIGLERHAIIAHSFVSVLAKLGITLSRNLSISRAPININRLLVY